MQPQWITLTDYTLRRRSRFRSEVIPATEHDLTSVMIALTCILGVISSCLSDRICLSSTWNLRFCRLLVPTTLGPLDAVCVFHFLSIYCAYPPFSGISVSIGPRSQFPWNPTFQLAHCIPVTIGAWINFLDQTPNVRFVSDRY